MKSLQDAMNAKPMAFVGATGIEKVYKMLSRYPRSLQDLMDEGFSRSGAEKCLKALDKGGLLAQATQRNGNILTMMYRIKE